MARGGGGMEHKSHFESRLRAAAAAARGMIGCAVSNVRIRLSSAHWLLLITIALMTFAVDTDKQRLAA